MATIKINRVELIKTLTAKVKEMEDGNKKFEAEKKKHDKAEEAWQKAVITAAVKNVSKATDLRVNQGWRSNGTTNIDFNVPTSVLPERPDYSEMVTSSYTQDYEIREVKQFIRMLEMAQDDAIAMTALKNVSQYL